MTGAPIVMAGAAHSDDWGTEQTGLEQGQGGGRDGALFFRGVERRALIEEWCGEDPLRRMR